MPVFTAPGWMDEFGGIVTVCDLQGTIVYMNDKSVENFQKDGGKALLGSNLLDCHPEPARSLLKELMEKCRINVYFTLKNGRKHLIYQSPLFENGVYSWFSEMILDIPLEAPTFKRG